LYQGERQLESLAFSPDGRRIAGRWFDRGITVWDRAAGRAIAEYRHPAWEQWNPHMQVFYTADNRLLAYGPDPISGKRWDVATGQPARALFPDNESFSTVTGGYDGFIVTVRDGHAAAWHLATATLRGTFTVGNISIGGFGLTPDGQTLAGYMNQPDRRPLHVWHADMGTHEEVPLADDSVAAVLAPDACAVAVMLPQPVVDPNPMSEWLALLFGDRFDPRAHYPRVRVIDIAKRRVLADFDRADRTAFAPDGRTLAVIGADGTVSLYDWPFGAAWRPILAGAALAAVATGALKALVATWRRRGSGATRSQSRVPDDSTITA
jgi:WD40 repeat protein